MSTNFERSYTLPEWMFQSPCKASKDPLTLRYTCAVCGLIEPLSFGNGYIRRQCRCEQQAHEETVQKQLQADASRAMRAMRAAKTYNWLGGTDDDLADKTFDTFNPLAQPDTATYQDTLNTCRDFATSLLAKETPGNLLLTGVYGTGKTHLAAAILNILRENRMECLFCTVPDFFSVLYASDFERKQHLLSQASTTPLLVLDDLDKLYVRHDTDGAFQKRTLFDIVDKRYKRHLSTIITTNEQNDLSPWLDGATISRLFGHINLLTLNGMDYRSR